jgi:hypothetical protein
MRPLAWVLAAVSFVAVPSLAAEVVVGNVGMRSVDVPTASLAPLESALDRAISMHAPSARGKTATLSTLAADPEVSSRRAEARRSADAGANAMRQLELDTAEAEFDKAATLFLAAHGDRLEPSEVARIYTTRGKVAQMQRSPQLMKGEFERAAPLHPTKQLDPATFPPESVALFAQVIARALETPMAPPSTSPLMDIAKRTRLQWIVAGEVRAHGATGNRIALSIVDAAGATRSVEFLVIDENVNPAFEGAVAKLFSDAGVPRGAPPVAAIGTPVDPFGNNTGTTGTTGTAVAAATPRPVPTQALPRSTPPPRKKPERESLDRKWYVVAGAAALALSAGAVFALQPGEEKKSTQDPPPEEGITLVITRP